MSSADISNLYFRKLTTIIGRIDIYLPLFLKLFDRPEIINRNWPIFELPVATSHSYFLSFHKTNRNQPSIVAWQISSWAISIEGPREWRKYAKIISLYFSYFARGPFQIHPIPHQRNREYSRLTSVSSRFPCSITIYEGREIPSFFVSSS